MARTTAGKLASQAAGAAKRVTAGVAKKAGQATTASKTTTSAKKAAKQAKPVTESTPPEATKPAAKKSSASAKAAAETTAAKRSATRATPPVKQAAPAKKTASKKSATKKTASKETASKETPPKAPAKKTSAAKTPTKAPAAPAKKGSPAARKTAAAAGGSRIRKAPKSAAKQSPSTLAVKADESPWTDAELDEVRAELTADVERLKGELDLAERELDDLMRDAGDGAGNDQADVGSTTFERDHEMSLANNARTMLTQTEHALERIADGTYGVCESCGQPIGKNRLMAFPRATLCLTCKQREERR